MNAITEIARGLAYPLLRVTMGIVLFWIGVLKFVDPSPVVGLLGASFSFLAFPAVVYLIGAIEVVLALALFANFKVQLAGLALMGLFVGTIAILLIAPKVSYGEAGFPQLSLAGEFLLKDLVLFAASVNLVVLASAQEATVRQARMVASRAV